MARRSLQGLGLICLVASAIWWWSFFQKVGSAMGVKAEVLARDVWPCLLYTTAPCQLAYSVAEMAGHLSYRPFMTWIGLSLFMLGCLLPGRKAIEAYQPPSRERREPRF